MRIIGSLGKLRYGEASYHKTFESINPTDDHNAVLPHRLDLKRSEIWEENVMRMSEDAWYQE